MERSMNIAIIAFVGLMA